MQCSSLREVLLNDGLKKIEDNIFQECIALQGIAIPCTVTEIGRYAFSCCRSLRDVVISNGLKKIGEYAFGDCTSLERIVIPSTLIEIEQYAFNDCSRLREVVIHNKEVQIDVKSFLGCTSLERFKFPSLSTRLDNIIQAGQRDIEDKMDDIHAVEWRGGELSIPAVRRGIQNRWGCMEQVRKIDKEKLDKIVRLIRYYEIREATTMFELALWKTRIGHASDIPNDNNRGAYRIEVPGPAKDTILQYLR